MVPKSRETLYFEHDDFKFYVSGQSLDSQRKTLRRTYSQRSLGQISGNDISVVVGGKLAADISGNELTQPFFFENRQYWFEIEFFQHVEPDSTLVSHKYRLIEQSFVPSQNPRHFALQAMINFGNDVGQCIFYIHYSVNGIPKSVPVEFTVLATKMVQHQDLSLMNHKIDTLYPLWRYSISSKTTQSQGRSARHPEKFELFWLAQFERLVAEFNRGIKRILHAPHNRLQSFSVQQNLDRISKKLTNKQQEHASDLISSERFSTRLRVSRKRLNIDTPENRFIKMVLERTKSNLAHLIHMLSAAKDVKISESFVQSLTKWREQADKFSRHQLWKEVGRFEGKSSESKVLQQAAGYSKVYKIWQQLKHYLNQADGEAKLSIKSVADIYEVWCFLEVKSIIESLGFKEHEKNLGNLKQVQFEKQFPVDEMAAAFVYKRQSDGMVIELAHEPSFTPKGGVNRTWLANQRPDIVLRVTLSNHEQFFILFDAKYRIDAQPFAPKDGVPEDAINQMHRYRDAIIHQQKLINERPLKSRPVMGAFALYPGFFLDQNAESNPYAEAINEIGIGAFALLPSADQNSPHNQWLRNYLADKLGASTNSRVGAQPPSNDYYFVEDATRIVPYGTSNVRHRGLTMVAPINEINRDEAYLVDARTGHLAGYHTQLVATNRQNIHRNIIREIRYLLLTVRDNSSDKTQFGKYLYRVRNVKLLPRRDIQRQFTGKESKDNHHYWLFEFIGEPMKLSTHIEKPYIEHFHFKLTKAELLHQMSHWDEIRNDAQFYTEFNPGW